MHTNDQSLSNTESLVRGALVTALYIVLTFLVAPVAFGPIQFRISEVINFLGLYNKRYIHSITLGVLFVNFYSYGIIDMLVGGTSTFIFLWITRWLGEFISSRFKQTKIDPMIIKYVVLIVVFSLSMFTIASMLVVLGVEAAFWPVYISLAISQATVLTIGAFIMYPLSKRVHFGE